MKNNKPKALSRKQIPTILGLLVLVAALIAGVVFFGEGTGVFAPRATPETTPKNIRITNIKDDSFTVSFYTEEAAPGFIKYGTEPDNFNTQVRDDRDQLSGSVEDFNLHHITLRGLEPDADYYFVLGTGSRAEFDQEGQPFHVRTTPKISTPSPETVTIFGSVALENGTPAQGSIVYVTAPDLQDLSSLVKGSGSWAIPLSQALNKAGNDYATLDEDDNIDVLVQGLSLDKKIQQRLTVSEAQPTELIFGQAMTTEQMESAERPEIDRDRPIDDEAPVKPESPPLQEEPGPELADDSDELAEMDDNISDNLKELLDEEEPLPQTSTASSEVLIGELKSTDDDEKVYTTQSPIIKGKLAPNSEVKIQINSENQYEEIVITDENGEFSLDLEALEASLEPGEHTITYSYIDPDTNQEVVKTEFFFVEDSDRATLAAADTESSDETLPYGTGSPYPITTPTLEPTVAVEPVETTTTSTDATEATKAVRENDIATESAYKAGSVGKTTLVAFLGIFFILIGSWSWWLAGELEEN